MCLNLNIKGTAVSGKEHITRSALHHTAVSGKVHNTRSALHHTAVSGKVHTTHSALHQQTVKYEQLSNKVIHREITSILTPYGFKFRLAE